MIEKYFHEYIFRDSEEKIDLIYDSFNEDMSWFQSFKQSINNEKLFDAIKNKLKKSHDQEKCISDLIREIEQESYEAKNILRQSESILKFLKNYKPKRPNPNAKVNPKKRKKKEHFNPDDVSETAFVKKEAREEKNRKNNRWG